VSVLPTLPLSEFDTTVYGVCKMRLGLGLSLFLPRPFEIAREGVHEIWKEYLTAIGATKLTWARLGGGNRSRKASDVVLKTIDSWLGGDKDFGEDCYISIHDGVMDELGTTGFYLEGYGAPDPDANDVGFLEIYLPLGLLDTRSGDELARIFSGMVDATPFMCGVAGFVFHHTPYQYDAVTARMAALSARFRGVEVIQNSRMCYWPKRGVTSVNWLTFVADHYLEKIGGRDAVHKSLRRGFQVRDLASGVGIRAGDLPLIGDANAGNDGLDAWRAVYRLLKPVMFNSPTAFFDADVFDTQRTRVWLTRLDSP
jgi:hypothetical protein